MKNQKVVWINIREVKHDVYGKQQTAKMKLLPSLFSWMYSRVKLFVCAMNSRRRYSIFVCFIYGLEEKNSKSEVIFAVCRLPLTSCLTSLLTENELETGRSLVHAESLHISYSGSLYPILCWLCLLLASDLYSFDYYRTTRPSKSITTIPEFDTCPTKVLDHHCIRSPNKNTGALLET